MTRTTFITWLVIGLVVGVPGGYFLAAVNIARRIRIRWNRLLRHLLRHSMWRLDPNGELGPFQHTTQNIPFWDYETTREALDQAATPLLARGTKSILFGAHCFFLHPWFVFAGWWKLYGFPRDPRLWVVFAIHDLGYWGMAMMDDDEGEKHPEWAALKMTKWFDKPKSREAIWIPDGNVSTTPFLQLPIESGMLLHLGYWGKLCLFHSRFYSKRAGHQPSQLCWADKQAVVYTWSWLYIPMAKATGEIYEYMRDHESSCPGEPPHRGDMKTWHASVRKYLAGLVAKHSDGSEDTSTKERNNKLREKRSDGVWE